MIFVGIKIIVSGSTHICKRATKIVSKEMVQTHVNIFNSEYITQCQHEVREDTNVKP